MPARQVHILDELYFAIYQVYHEFIPLPEDRIQLTWRNALTASLHWVPFLFMAYLVRRRDTHLIRLLLLPTTLGMVIRDNWRYAWLDPKDKAYNWIRAFGALVIVAKCLDFAFAKEGRIKKGETRLLGINEPTPTPFKVERDLKEEQTPPLAGTLSARILPVWLLDAFDVAFSMRGIGWDFGKGVRIPKDTRPSEPSAFLKITLWLFLQNYLILDFSESVIKLIPGIGSLEGGSMFFSDLPRFHRYAVSFVIHLISCACLTTALNAIYYTGTLIGVGVLHQSPSSWPPLMDRPWASESLHEFWGRRWHQEFRYVFLTYGGFPGKWIGGHLGLIVGTFIASGYLHQASAYTMDLDYRASFFFVLNAGGMLLETAWRTVTGRRVGGLFGMVWTYAWMLVIAQMFVDAWYMTGLAGCMMIPPIISPTRQILFPILQAITHYNLASPLSIN